MVATLTRVHLEQTFKWDLPEVHRLFDLLPRDGLQWMPSAVKAPLAGKLNIFGERATKVIYSNCPFHSVLD